jgi:hypothetical protein
MPSTSDREKYKKYKALCIQLNDKYLKHKNMNKKLKDQLNNIQNGGNQNNNNNNNLDEDVFTNNNNKYSKKNDEIASALPEIDSAELDKLKLDEY